VDVLVLDLNLPGDDGLVIASRLRKTHPNLGVVMLTGRISVADRVIGLESGGDMYLCKPVERRELVAAIRAVSRRVVIRRRRLWSTSCCRCFPKPTAAKPRARN
jgi:two-component system phosphate regulon response regulator OmpR